MFTTLSGDSSHGRGHVDLQHPRHQLRVKHDVESEQLERPTGPVTGQFAAQASKQM